ncbi:MAG: hypothetical protein ACF8PN_06540 [Phycisphaerales bacterium]
MDLLADWIVSLHASLGPTLFFVISTGLAIACFLLITVTTDLMVNNAAGLTAKFLGPKARTLVINASTNNPELATMIVSMGIRRMGGWANPLGSLLANFYLMYLLAIVFVMVKFAVLGQFSKIRQLISLLVRERRLLGWHLVMAAGALVFGTSALLIMRHGLPFFGSRASDSTTPATGIAMYVALGILVAAIALFFLLERRLKKSRPELFTDIDASEHSESWLGFVAGAAGLIGSCWVMNELFVAWSEVYGEALQAITGPVVFLALHYVIGSLMTSLPELLVAMQNYQRLTIPDLNTALGSASYSNLTNLIIAALGLIVFIALTGFGVVLPWQ